MERDFMGMSSKDPLAVVKEESAEGVPRPLPNNSSALLHFVSFKAAQEEKPTKAMFKSTSAEAIETSYKPPSGIIQNYAGAAAKQLQLGGVPVRPPQSIFSSQGYVTGTTAPWFNSKPSGAPAQLTIFYGGTVNVYNDISPEKAEAIMLLAGNVFSHGINKSQARTQIHISSPGKEEEDNVQPTDNCPATNGIPSPVSVCSHLVSGPKSNSEANQIGVSASPITNFELDPPKVVGSIRSLAATAMIQSVIPQSRKASLARFLEKRKERVMNSAPYNLCKKSSEIGTTPVSDGATSSISISTGKECIQMS